MPAVPLDELLSATGGELRGRLAPETAFASVEPNPGAVRAGDLYLALPGPRVDGHEHAFIAALRGAAAALVARRWADSLAELPLPLVVVDDPLGALHRLAAARRRGLAATVVGVTGSVGKTTTKELTAAVLEQRFRTYRSPGNRNNEIGLPLSLLEVEPDTEVAVLELGGGYAFGELELLAGIARPRVGVVTNVAPVHLERLGSLDAIARAKAELVQALPEDGVAVLNGDDPRVRAMAEKCRGDVVTFGLGRENAVRAEAVETHGLAGSSLTLVLGGERVRLTVRVPGPHVPQLVLAATAAAHALGLPPAAVAAALGDRDLAVGPRCVPGPRGSLLLDDAYNASPPSVRSALRLLAEIPARRRIAVLGDMLELGAIAEEEHRALAGEAAALDLLVTVGPLAQLAAGDPPAGRSFALGEGAELVDFLAAELREGDVVLVKGSHALALGDVVEALHAGEA